MLDHVLYPCVSLAPVISLPGELSFCKLSSQKSEAGLWSLELIQVGYFNIMWKLVRDQSRKKTSFGDLCSSSSSEKLSSHLVTKT